MTVIVPKNWLEAEDPPLLSKLVLPLVFRPPLRVVGAAVPLRMLKPAFNPFEDKRRALVPMSLLARVVSFNITVRVSPTRTARRSSKRPLCVVAAGLEVGTKEPLEVETTACVSGRAVVSPLTKDCFEAEGNSAQPAKKAATKIRNESFFITVVLTFAAFDRKPKLTWL